LVGHYFRSAAAGYAMLRLPAIVVALRCAAACVQHAGNCVEVTRVVPRTSIFGKHAACVLAALHSPIGAPASARYEAVVGLGQQQRALLAYAGHGRDRAQQRHRRPWSHGTQGK
jgi:hypothetical protein